MIPERFAAAIVRMEPLMERLTASDPIRVDRDGLRGVPRQGVYVFFENDRPLYVGRSNNLQQRIRQHGAAGSGRYSVMSATFAFKLLLEEIGEQSDLTRKQIQDLYPQEYRRQRDRVRRMEVRVVEITDQVEQTIFEIYAVLELGTVPRYNTFETY